VYSSNLGPIHPSSLSLSHQPPPRADPPVMAQPIRYALQDLIAFFRLYQEVQRFANEYYVTVKFSKTSHEHSEILQEYLYRLNMVVLNPDFGKYPSRYLHLATLQSWPTPGRPPSLGFNFSMALSAFTVKTSLHGAPSRQMTDRTLPGALSARISLARDMSSFALWERS
jgi:hypothetical protein